MKKKNWFIVLAVALMSTTMVACLGDDDDDDDDNNVATLENAYEVGGTEYDLDKGTVILYGSDGAGAYDNDLKLLSPGVTLTIVNNDLDTIYGIGHGFSVATTTSSMADIAAGTYTFDTINIPAGSWYEGSYIANYNFETDNGLEKELVSGTFELAKAGSTYTLGFEGKDEDGNTVKMHYEGTLDMIDWSKKKGEKKKLW